MAEPREEPGKSHELAVEPPRRRRGTRPPPRTRLRIGNRKDGRGRALWESTFSNSRLQRSTVKVSYSKNGARGAWAAHGRYLARDGAQREGERGKGFGRELDEVDIPKELGRWQREGDPRLFKLIVSPEAGASMDLRAHARSLMALVEKDLGTGLEWVAIDHHNTDNPHVHVVLRGIDTKGHELRIDREYVKTGFRQRSQEVATQTLGLRTERSLLSAREQLVQRQRFTEIDRVLLRRADEHGVVRYDGPVPARPGARELRLIELKRLSKLETMGLAERVGDRSWIVRANLETALREFQRATDVLRSRSRHQALISNPEAPLVRTELEPGMKLTGKIVGAGLADEATGARYVLLEGTDGRVHYVERSGDGPSVRPGRIATLVALASENRSGARPVHIRAHEHGKLEEIVSAREVGGVLDREALAEVAERGDVEPASEGNTFPHAWRRAVASRVRVLEESRFVVAREEGERRFDLTPAGREVMERLMNTLERHLPTLEEMAATKRQAIERRDPEPGMHLRGKLVGYAADPDGNELAVISANRRLVAVEARGERLTEGKNVAVRADEVESENNRRRMLVWRIEAERSLERGR